MKGWQRCLNVSTCKFDLQAFALVGPPRANPGPGPPSCTTPQQLTIYTTLKLQISTTQFGRLTGSDGLFFRSS